MTGRKIPKGKRDKNDGPLFVEDDDDFQKNPTIGRAYKRALKEGRVNGPHKCPVCGMKFLTEWEADDCCWVKED